MISLTNTELIIKLLTSVLFRLLIICYAIFLLTIQTSTFSPYVYFFISLIYLMFYLVTLKKSFNFLRTIVDFIYIGLILYEKDLSIFYNIIFIVFPLLNSPNHTRTKRNPWQLYFLTIFILFILLYINTENIFSIEYVYITISLFVINLINLFEYKRSNLRNKLLNIYDEIDDFLASNHYKSSQLPHIYEIIQKKFYEEMNFNIKQIISFKIKNNGLTIKNSSIFVHHWNFGNAIQALEESSVLFNEKIQINSLENSNNIILKIQKKYIFVLFTDETNRLTPIIKFLTTFEIMIKLLEKLVSIIEFEDRLYKRKTLTLKQLNKHMNYVSVIMKSTHFLSNEFSPIASYFDLKDKYFDLKNSSDIQQIEVASQLLLILEDEEKKAKESLNNIHTKILQILNKNENPFKTKELEIVKFSVIFMVIQRLWTTKFSTTGEEIETQNFDSNSDKKCKVDIQALEFIFVDVFENVRKYSEHEKHLKFDFGTDLVIVVSNKIKEYKKNKIELDKTVTNFNNNDRIEINKRNNFGLSHIKDHTQDLDIDTSIQLDHDNKLFIMKFVIKTKD